MKRILTCITLLVAMLFATPCAHGQETFKRGLEQISFVPKGQWIAGVSVSYSQSNQDNYKFFIVEGINGDTYNFKIGPMLMYSFHDNLAAGARFAFNRTKIDLRGADIVLDSETQYNIDNLYSLSQSWTSILAFRNYISLGNNRRFGLFNEVQVEIGGGDSKLCSGSGDNLTGTFSRHFSLNVGLAPGLIMFLNNYSALEVNVGVLGFNYTHTKATTDQIYVAHTTAKSANFRVNLFSITFGVAFYL